MTEIDARTKLAVVAAALVLAMTAPALNAQQQRLVADSTRMRRAVIIHRQSVRPTRRRTSSSMGAANPWMKFFLEHDVLAAARLVRQPVLILNGATDLQVTAEQAEQLAAAIRAGGNHDVTAHVFPAVNHLFIYDPIGTPSGYARLSRSALEPEVVGLLVEWLVQKLR